MMEDYLSAAQHLETQNQFNRLHIDLSTTMTPLQCAELHQREQEGLLPRQATPWLRRLRRLSPDLAVAPQPWIATPVNERLTWYHAGDDQAQQSGPGVVRSVKDLDRPILIAFCGNADRLMVPLPIILQALPALSWSVLRVTRARGSSYLPPGREIQSLLELLGAIEHELERRSHSQLVCMGTSSGGFIAILAALHLEALRCVSFSGTWAESWLPMLPEISFGKLPRTAAQEQAAPEFLLVYGELNEKDRRNAVLAQELVRGQVLPIPGVAKHNVIHRLAQRGRLDSELHPLLCGEARG